MVSAEKEWSVQHVTELVKSQVAFLRVKLGVLHNIGLEMANFFEDLLVEVETALVHSASWLPLRAHAEHRLKPLELGHSLPHLDQVVELVLYFHSRYIITNLT